jgi:general secretion pathway protein L
MNIIGASRQAFAQWMDCVARTVVASLDGFGTRRTIRLVEGPDGLFAFHAVEGTKRRWTRSGKRPLPPYGARLDGGPLEGLLPREWAAALRGSRIEVLLRADRFLFRPLELPRRAADFLDGIVRAQIDRLTPWVAPEAAFNWTAPTQAGGDRIRLTVVATARSIVSPYLAAVGNVGAASVCVAAFAPSDAAAAPIVVLRQNARGEATIERYRRVFATLLLVGGLIAAASFAVGAVAAGALDADQQSLSRKIETLRASMRVDRNSESSALRMLERRKHAAPSGVIVLEALSRILPDHTYVTELRIDGDKLQLIGVTADAPSLIQLIEASPHFARATFFAPTTQTPGDPGERFHIEARIKPDFTAGS